MATDTQPRLEIEDIDDLQTELERIDQNTNTAIKLATNAGEEIATLKDRLDAIEEQLERAEAANDGQKERKIEKFERIITHACNKTSDGPKGVVLDYSEVMASTGVSRQYAHTLMDEMGAKYPFATTKQQPGKKKQLRIRTSGTTADELTQQLYQTENGDG